MGTIFTLLIALILLGFSAMFSGLTLGLLSLNIFELRRKCELGNTEAKLVYPIRARGNELLVTLIVGNVLVNAALTVTLEALFPGSSPWSAILTVLTATVLITFFGEILPQAFFKKHGLSIGARFSPYINFVMEVMRPVSRPLGKLLDKTVGVETPEVFSQDELVMILEEHERSEDSEIEADEMEIVRNALKFGDKLVRDVMTPASVVKAISHDEKFTMGVLQDLTKSGHSRFPVYDGDLDNVVGILFLRDLIANHNENLTAGKAADRDVTFVNEKQLLDHVLNGFLKTKKHLFIAVNEYGETVGLITIEDILEEIIGKEIVDEFDQYDDLREVARLKAKKRPRRKMVGKIK